MTAPPRTALVMLTPVSTGAASVTIVGAVAAGRSVGSGSVTASSVGVAAVFSLTVGGTASGIDNAISSDSVVCFKALLDESLRCIVPGVAGMII